MWRRLLPYAAALWAMNVLINVFFLTDRYMILHLLPNGEMGGQAAVGQYHSGRIIPGLFMSLATLVSGVLMPYLTADWEAGRQDRVRERLQQILFAVASTFTAGAALALWISPWLFAEFLEGRYSEGLQLMPMAFVIAIWFALATIGQDYLWVAERGKLAAAAIGVGLLVNIAMNFALLPIWGLRGAVVGTLLANGVMLVGIWTAMARHGFSINTSMLFLSLLPATLLAGPGVAIAFVGITAMASPTVRTWTVEASEMMVHRWQARLATDSKA
jgi:O-antigen/teichoic acid export membrane protein